MKPLMRRCLVLALLLAGCSRGESPNAGFSAPLGQLAPAAAAPARRGNCGAVAECAQACQPPGLAACVAACELKLDDQGRPLYRALRACSIGHCEAACKTPTDFGCKACVMGSCASEAASCLAN